ncbi:hypothetical protein SxD43FB_08655 [Sphingobium sp. D43FB]|nr:hypothetical protein SxD43FB_08655 [Sphingobium sp. D43FB]
MMRFKKMPSAEIQPDDDELMATAIVQLRGYGADVRRPEGSSFQLKLPKGVNFYPTTGKIYIDGGVSALSQKGLEALLLILRDQGTIANPA